MKKRSGFWAALALAALVLLCMGVTLVVETGPGKAAECFLAPGEAVTVSDSIPGWERVTSVIAVAGAGGGEVGLALDGSGWTEMGIDPSQTASFPLRFMSCQNISRTSFAESDTVVKAVSGSMRVYVFGE